MTKTQLISNFIAALFGGALITFTLGLAVYFFAGVSMMTIYVVSVTILTLSGFLPAVRAETDLVENPDFVPVASLKRDDDGNLIFDAVDCRKTTQRYL